MVFFFIYIYIHRYIFFLSAAADSTVYFLEGAEEGQMRLVPQYLSFSQAYWSCREYSHRAQLKTSNDYIFLYGRARVSRSCATN